MMERRTLTYRLLSRPSRPGPGGGEAGRTVYSVSELTARIRQSLEDQFTGIWIEGEISNFKLHTSGHLYFSLKDESAQIQCVLFRGEAHRIRFEPGDGMKVLCYGRVSVYPVRGQYQLYVQEMEPKGIGALQLRFQQLKEKLSKEGLFDESRKKPIPFLPSRIGIVTSKDGAALRDILNVLDRRHSNVHVLIYSAQVQGTGAAESIAEAIGAMNRFRLCDVLIVGRGGGSLEDLWAFNEETAVRAIFESRIPVISAVGHEVDFTLADFAADRRAATPSAAAEIVMPRREDLLASVADFKSRLFQSAVTTLKELRLELRHLRESRPLKYPLAVFEAPFQKLDEIRRELGDAMRSGLEDRREKLLSRMGKLEALGPLATLQRGFSVTLKIPGGQCVTTYRGVKTGDRIRTRLREGVLVSRVETTQKGETNG